MSDIGYAWKRSHELEFFIKNSLILLLVVALVVSFWGRHSWTVLCAGLALFLFGMQCLEEGLRHLAGEKLEHVLARGTETRFKSLMIGLVGTSVLQPSTLVSLMTIAFISTGLIGLIAGISIILGANLGATTGIWLLALAGQNFGLAPLAMPLMILGVLSRFFGPKAKALGRILLGIAFILLGIEQIRTGFSSVTQTLNLSQVHFEARLGGLVFVGAGLVLTLILQSTHATLMLTLTALSLGQVDLMQAAAIAIGANVGSSVTTGLAGALGGSRGGQQLALVHILFNVTTAIIAIALLPDFLWLTQELAALLGSLATASSCWLSSIRCSTGLALRYSGRWSTPLPFFCKGHDRNIRSRICYCPAVRYRYGHRAHTRAMSDRGGSWFSRCGRVRRYDGVTAPWAAECRGCLQCAVFASKRAGSSAS